MDNLNRRKISKDPLYVVCGCESESSDHILYKVEFIQSCVGFIPYQICL